MQHLQVHVSQHKLDKQGMPNSRESQNHGKNVRKKCNHIIIVSWEIYSIPPISFMRHVTDELSMGMEHTSHNFNFFNPKFSCSSYSVQMPFIMNLENILLCMIWLLGNVHLWSFQYIFIFLVHATFQSALQAGNYSSHSQSCNKIKA